MNWSLLPHVLLTFTLILSALACFYCALMLSIDIWGQHQTSKRPRAISPDQIEADRAALVAYQTEVWGPDR